MCESKEGEPQVGERFCVWKTKESKQVELVEESCEEVEMVRGFCYLWDRMNASVGCEAAVTARASIG